MNSSKQHSILDDLLAEPAQTGADVFVALIADLAEQVKVDMQAEGLTRRTLAQRLGKSESEITKWLSGLHNLTLQSVAKLSAALQVDLLTTRLNPQGYFGRQHTPIFAGQSVVTEIVANSLFSHQPSSDATRRYLLAAVQEPTGERQTLYEFAA